MTPSTPQPITLEALTGTPAPISKPKSARPWLDLWVPSKYIRFNPPKNYVLMGDSHLTRGNITVLGGWPGVGKSRAALALAISGATGRPWLGQPVHTRFRTVIMQVENGEWRLKQELTEALATAMPQGPAGEESMDQWLAISRPPAFGLAFHEPAFRQHVSSLLRENRPDLIIIDPWNRVAEGDKQGDYRQALESIMECLPDNPEEKPAILIIHHMRKKSSESTRKQGRDLLHELAGSYQIGSAARCVFILEPGSNSTTDPHVVLTCCKNNDGREGAPSAWVRGNGLFTPAAGFDMEAFLSPDPAATGLTRGRSTSQDAVAKALSGMAGENKGQAVSRLVSAGVCGKSTAYSVLAGHANVEEDASGKLWWREDLH